MSVKKFEFISRYIFTYIFVGFSAFSPPKSLHSRFWKTNTKIPTIQIGIHFEGEKILKSFIRSVTREAKKNQNCERKWAHASPFLFEIRITEWVF
jgi:hypothetical protein